MVCVCIVSPNKCQIQTRVRPFTETIFFISYIAALREQIIGRLLGPFGRESSVDIITDRMYSWDHCFQSEKVNLYCRVIVGVPPPLYGPFPNFPLLSTPINAYYIVKSNCHFIQRLTSHSAMLEVLVGGGFWLSNSYTQAVIGTARPSLAR